jgi:hypothetical protein
MKRRFVVIMYVGVDADEEAEAYDAIKNLTVDQSHRGRADKPDA